MNQQFSPQSLQLDASTGVTIFVQQTGKVSADLDKANNLPEEMTRRQKKIDKKEEYAIA